jgi:tyrosine-specific transport protein
MSSFVKTRVQEGSLLGGALLIAGSCIGAGMLALPAVTSSGGFGPSVCLFFLAWSLMLLSGHLLMKTNLQLGYGYNLLSLSQMTLGKIGKWVVSSLFLFLFYSLTVAYLSALCPIVQQLLIAFFSTKLSIPTIQIALTGLMGLCVFLGIRPVDWCNRFLMGLLIIVYMLLVVIGSQHVKLVNLLYSDWQYAYSALPILIISFGYHNMIPSLCRYLKGDEKRLQSVLLLGTAIPLICYIFWQLIILGIVPPENWKQIVQEGKSSTFALLSVSGAGSVSLLGQFFALFAILTSLLAQTLSLVDFLADAFKKPAAEAYRVFYIVLSLAPPFICCLIWPDIFLKALNFSGALIAVVLFGIIPSIMIMKLKVIVSKWSLYSLLLVSGSIFFIELLEMMGCSIFPRIF